MNSLQKVLKAKGVLTVGISGVTCGGKSSMANLLKAAFPSASFICQDDFYYSDPNALPKAKGEGCSGFANWDSILSLDMVSMMKKVQTTLRELEEKPNPSLLIIDGFLIFNYPPLAELCDLKYFLTLPYEECLKRRLKRTYDPPDPPGYFIGTVVCICLLFFFFYLFYYHFIRYLIFTQVFNIFL